MNDPHILTHAALEKLCSKLNEDSFCMLTESEFQNRFTAILRSMHISRGPIEIPMSVTFPNDKRNVVLGNRIYREIVFDREQSRNSPKPDIVIYGDGLLTGRPKENSAISSYRGSVFGIYELKYNCSIAGSNKDLLKYHVDYSDRIICINLKRTDGESSFLKSGNIYQVSSGASYQHTGQVANFEDTRSAAISSIESTWNEYINDPTCMIREKDFEDRISALIENKIGRDSCQVFFNNNKYYTTPVRNQITNTNAIFNGSKRRHDIVIAAGIKFGDNGVGRIELLDIRCEIEVKTSHSSSHNIFRNGFSEELEKMSKLNNAVGNTALCVIYRLGSPIFVKDYLSFKERFPNVEFMYLCSNGDRL